jgi:hypothetical protein
MIGCVNTVAPTSVRAVVFLGASSMGGSGGVAVMRKDVHFAICALAMVMFLVEPALCSISSSGTCILAGYVTDALSGQKVHDTTVELTALGGGDDRHDRPMERLHLLPLQPASGVRYETRSGSNGEFCFGSVPQSQYILSAKREGFLDSNYGTAAPSQLSAILDLAQDQPLDVIVRIWPEATVSELVNDFETPARIN